MSFYGTGLGPATPLNAQVVNGVVQSNLGGYQLLFGGVAAALLYIGANQINAVVPSEVSGKDSVSVTLVTPTGIFSLADLYIRPSEPEIFHDPVVGTAVAINQDGTLNSDLIRYLSLWLRRPVLSPWRICTSGLPSPRSFTTLWWAPPWPSTRTGRSTHLRIRRTQASWSQFGAPAPERHTPGCSPPMARLSLSQETSSPIPRCRFPCLIEMTRWRWSTPEILRVRYSACCRSTSGSRSPGLSKRSVPSIWA